MNDFITIDFETAAKTPESAISIGMVKYHNYKPIASYYSLICPPKLYIRPDFTDIHGLTIDDVKDAPDFRYIWEHEIRGFFSTIPLAAHNAPFDMNVLRSTLAYYEISPPDIPVFCSLALSRKVWPRLHSHALSALAKEHGIIYDAHNALSDAKTCGKIIELCALDVSEQEGRKTLLVIENVLEQAGVAMERLNDDQAQNPCIRTPLDKNADSF